MNKWVSVISTIVLLMIVTSSIIQFHHHDENGDIVFGISKVMNHECHNESHHFKRSHTHDCSHCGCNHSENDSAENCSAHLGDYQIAKQTFIFNGDFPIYLLNAILIEYFNNNISATETSFNNDINYIASICDGVFKVASLRAPPVC